MQIQSFEHLHQDVFRALGQSAEPIQQDDAVMSFSFAVGGVEATALYAPQRGSDCAFVMVSLGEPDAQQKEAAMMELMEANFAWMTQQPSVAASSHALTGGLCIQFAYPLAHADAEHLLARVDAIGAWSAGWLATRN